MAGQKLTLFENGTGASLSDTEYNQSAVILYRSFEFNVNDFTQE